jgi:GNAT superfamily N-acetyltransferase
MAPAERPEAGSLSIRLLAASDRDWVARYWRERWGSERLAVHDRIYDIMDLSGFVAERDGEPAGMLTYLVRGDECEIMTFDSVTRFTGTGTALIERVKAEAMRQGCARLKVTTTNDNLDALRFYQRRGFRLTAVEAGAVDRQRRYLKPEIPVVGEYQIPVRDELHLRMDLTQGEVDPVR